MQLSITTWSGLCTSVLWCWCRDWWCLHTDRALLQGTGVWRGETETLLAPLSRLHSSGQSPPPATSGETEKDKNWLQVNEEDTHWWVKLNEKESHLSELIIVRVDIMKAFYYMSRGPQDPTRVDWVKQFHGDSGAWHCLHMNRHHWLVYNTHTIKSIPQRSDCKYCPAD